MTLLFGFAPFILFAMLSRLSADLALWLAFAAAFVVTIRDFVESPSLRLLDGTSLALFGLLALIAGLCRSRSFHWPWCAPSWMRCYAWRSWFPFCAENLFRCNMPAGSPSFRTGRLPAFLRVNQLISLVWGVAFAAHDPGGRRRGVPVAALLCGHCGASVLALAGAITFTFLYPALAAERLAR